MTVDQMHFRFKLRFDKIDSFSLPEYSPEEIDELLNMAQQFLIVQITKDGIEKNEENMDYLMNITKSYRATTYYINANNKLNGVFVYLPADYRTALLEMADLSYIGCGGNPETYLRATVIPTTRDRYNKIILDPFNKPDRKNIIRLVSEPLNGTPTFELVSSDGCTMDAYYLDYIKEPERIQFGTKYATTGLSDISCELSEKAQEKIIEIAVNLAMDSLKLASPQQQQQNN